MKPKDKIKALEFAKEKITNRINKQVPYYLEYGICAIIQVYYNDNIKKVGHINALEYIPELEQFRPHKNRIYGFLWYSITKRGDQARIRLIDKTIKLIKSQKK